MARLVIRQLDDEVDEKLRCRARRHGLATPSAVLAEIERRLPSRSEPRRGWSTSARWQGRE